MRGRVKRALVAALLMVGALLAPAATAQEAATPFREHGYIEMPDGVQLKWTVLRPKESGRFPVLMQYEGYNAGNNPTRVNSAFAKEMLEDGYAILGVSVRGTACSSGTWDMFHPIHGEDGARAVEWAAAQPWSNGKVGMFSYSFGGIMQLFTAGAQPEGLAAIAPGMVVADTYRDVGFPGGMLNDVFPLAWMAVLHVAWAQAAPQALADDDAGCLANIARHQVENVPQSLVVQGLQHPTLDAWHLERSPERVLDRIDVPVLGMTAWQDEQTGPRGGLAFDRLNPDTTWTIGTNGHHGMYQHSPTARANLHRFFDRYLKGERNGWERTPHVQLFHETAKDGFAPAWISSSDTRPFPIRPTALHLQPGGQLAAPAPPAQGGATTYTYGVPGAAYGPDNAADLLGGPGITWQTSTAVPGASAAFTTAPLERDLGVTGTASLDAWVSVTAPDADLQATVTEVRPDGQEVYVQRGWLRLSHRAVDEAKSSPTLPVHPFTAEAQQNVPLGEPVLARVEVMPFTHVFREGSRLRVWLDTPSVTGMWGFLHSPLPAAISVLHNAEHPSRLVLGVMPGERARTALPPCGTVASETCRPDPLGADGTTGAPAPGASPSPGGNAPSAPNSPRASPALPATGSPVPPGLLFLGAIAILSLRRLRRLTGA